MSIPFHMGCFIRYYIIYSDMVNMKSILLKLIIFVKSFLQRLLITVQLYFQNGLANHSAACAYGFLLSMAPILLLIAFILSFTFKASPAAINALLAGFPFWKISLTKTGLSAICLSFQSPVFRALFPRWVLSGRAGFCLFQFREA